MPSAAYTLYRGTAPTTANTVLFTTPTDVAVAVEYITVANSTAAAVTYSIALGGFPIASGTSLPANSTHYIDLSQVVYNGETITGNASSANAIAFHIAGSDVI